MNQDHKKGTNVLHTERAHIDCRELFKINWQTWKVLGITASAKCVKNKSSQHFTQFAQLFWNYFVNITTTFMFPLHIIMGVLNPYSSQEDIFAIIGIFFTTFGASLKIISFALNMKSIMRMELILQELDKRIHHVEDALFFAQHIKRPRNLMARTLMTFYFGTSLSVSLAAVIRREPKLIYAGWLPFDWHQSWWHFAAVYCFQLHGIFFQTMQNFTTDIFSTTALCVLAGHTNLLYKRVARIGYYPSLKSDEHEHDDMELHGCITHHTDLYELCEIIEKIISWPLLFQIFLSFASLGVAMVGLVFFATDFFYRVYYILYFMAMTLQLLPVCYYGSYFVILLENLRYATFSCNWTGQSRCFKRHMMLFAERSLKSTILRAGNVFPIHLRTFFATIKGAYSIFALLITMK